MGWALFSSYRLMLLFKVVPLAEMLLFVSLNLMGFQLNIDQLFPRTPREA